MDHYLRKGDGQTVILEGFDKVEEGFMAFVPVSGPRTLYIQTHTHPDTEFSFLCPVETDGQKNKVCRNADFYKLVESLELFDKPYFLIADQYIPALDRE